MATTNKQRPTKTKPSSAKASPPAKRSVPIAGIAFGAIAIILVLAVVLTGGQTDTPEQFGDVDVDGAALPLYPQDLASISDDPAIGSTIPTLNGEDLDGNAMTISADGVPKGIAFLAHWCPHCQVEVPRVAEWVETTGGVEGVEIVSVTTSINPIGDNYPPDKWLRDEGWPSAVMRDDQNQTAHLAYGGGGFPYWVFVSADGEVVARTEGQLDNETLEGFLTLARDS